MLMVSGKTEEKQVVSGLFTLVGTHGLPLEVILQYLKDNEMVIDWIDYITYAMKDGAKFKTVKARIIAAIGDVFGPKYLENFLIRLEICEPIFLD